MNTGNKQIPAISLLAFTQELFMRVGVGGKEANTIATSLVEANLRGVDSHGVSRVPIYVKRMSEGLIQLQGEIEIIQETAGSALINGKNLPGIIVAQRAIELAVEKAQVTGLAIVGVNESNHCGMLAYYAKYAVKNGCLVIITSNASPSMAPWGGKERYFGTNPFCYGIPAGEENPIILDIATSVVAKGKIRLAEAEGRSIPQDWAISKEGQLTTDPREALAGLVLPFGGAKGYGLVLLIDVLSGILTGANFGPHVSSMFESRIQGVGHSFIAIRADLFGPYTEFTTKVDQMIREIRNVQPMEGVDRIYLPGEIEFEREQLRRTEGIPLPESLLEELRQLGRARKVDLEDYW